MKINGKMIDKQLRFKGRMMFFTRSKNVKWFKRKYGFFAKMARLFLGGRNIRGINCSQMSIQGRDGNSIRLRIYRPKDYRENELLPAILWLHGGGFAIGVPELVKPYAKTFLKNSRVVIVCPDYRLSTEAPYPAAFNDSCDALLYMKEHSKELGIKDDQIMVGGDSAGGGLTAAITLYARDTKEVAISFQMPLYPMLDDRMETASMKDNNAPVWDEATNRCAWKLYLDGLYGKDDVPHYAAPGRAINYEGLPPTFTFAGQLEPFRDEIIAYVNNLKEAGIPVEFHLYEAAYHGFDTVAPRADISKDSKERLAKALAYAIEHYYAPQPSKKK